jgi:hypothetical protein
LVKFSFLNQKAVLVMKDKKEQKIFDFEFYRNYWNKNSQVIIYSALFSIIAFGYELFNYTLSIDDELQAFKSANDNANSIIAGRWGMYFLNVLIVPHSVLPFFPTLLALICITLTAILFLTTEENTTSSALVFSLIFVTNPVHAYYLPWIGAMFYAFGMVLVVCAYIALKKVIETEKFSWKSYAFSIVFLGFALSIYQALISVFLVLGAYYLFNSQFTNSGVIVKHTFTNIWRIIIVTAFAFIFYKIGDISSRFFLFNGIYLNESKYLDYFVGWGKLSITEILFTFFKYTGGYLAGIKNFGDAVSLTYRTTILLLIFATYFIVKSPLSNKARMVSLFLLCAFVLSPFSLMYLIGNSLPTRGFLGLPLMIALLWLFVYRSAGKVLKGILVAGVIIIFLNNTQINTRLFFSSYVSWQADRDMANRITERIYSLDPPETNGLVKVAFIGSYKHPKNTFFIQSDVFGASFFGWDNGNPGRINSFFKTLGINNLEMAEITHSEELDKQIVQMPEWPSKGSVKLIDDVVFVKLSEKNKNRKQQKKR